MKALRLLLLASLCLAVVPSHADDTSRGDGILRKYGLPHFSTHLRVAFDAYIRAEDFIKGGKAEEARKLLRAFWKKYPQGDPIWWRLPQNAGGVFMGHPPVYSALKIITYVAETGTLKASKKLRLTILVVGKTRGIQPQSLSDFRTRKGIRKTHRISRLIMEKNYRAYRESIWLFDKYVTAMTKGQYGLTLNFVYLPELNLKVHAYARKKLYISGLPGSARVKLWKSLDPELVKKTDWWQIIYPSAIPGKRPEFENTGFITGGMGRGPGGKTPCFVADDKWFLQAASHFRVNRKTYTGFERRIYLSQWFEHEFFHWLYGTYPEFGFEKKSHQWHNRKSWPRDFKGAFESDYYQETLRRILRSAKKPLSMAFHLRMPDGPVFSRVKSGNLPGTFVRKPELNKWHRGTISRSNSRDFPFVWTNKAGRTWGLRVNMKTRSLETDRRNPYRKYKLGKGFVIKLKQKSDGEYSPVVEGFYFNGELYEKLK